jgi:hypothetical protein
METSSLGISPRTGMLHDAVAMHQERPWKSQEELGQGVREEYVGVFAESIGWTGALTS